MKYWGHVVEETNLLIKHLEGEEFLECERENETKYWTVDKMSGTN